MRLTHAEVRLFYDLYAPLLSFVNRKLEVSSAEFSTAAEYTTTPFEARVTIRDGLFEHRELIDEFVAENPTRLTADALEIVAAWKHAVVGKFYVFRYLKQHAVFLASGGSPNRAFGVIGLADPLEEVVGSHLPRLVTTVLLPFRGKIIYDGLVSVYNITLGGGIKRMLNEEYKQARAAFGIITSLGEQAAPFPEKTKPEKGPRKATAVVVPRSASAEAKVIAEELIEMTDAFCREFRILSYASGGAYGGGEGGHGQAAAEAVTQVGVGADASHL